MTGWRPTPEEAIHTGDKGIVVEIQRSEGKAILRFCIPPHQVIRSIYIEHFDVIKPRPKMIVDGFEVDYNPDWDDVHDQENMPF